MCQIVSTFNEEVGMRFSFFFILVLAICFCCFVGCADKGTNNSTDNGKSLHLTGAYRASGLLSKKMAASGITDAVAIPLYDGNSWGSARF